MRSSIALEDKDPFKLQVTTLTAESYHASSNDMEILLRGKGLSKGVDTRAVRGESMELDG